MKIKINNNFKKYYVYTNNFVYEFSNFNDCFKKSNALSLLGIDNKIKISLV